MLRTNFQPRSRGDHAEIFSNYFRFGSKAGKQRPENIEAVIVVRLLAIYGGICAAVLPCYMAVGSVVCTAALMCYFDAAALTTLDCCCSCFRFAFRFSALNFMVLAIGIGRTK